MKQKQGVSHTQFSIHYHMPRAEKSGPVLQAHIGTSLIDVKEGHCNNHNYWSLPNYFHFFPLGRQTKCLKKDAHKVLTLYLPQNYILKNHSCPS